MKQNKIIVFFCWDYS